ncbi:MAG TPA: SpoIIE family protein phosphatase, partial [Acidimicrobiia bacterium]|nr:SpoIIE family protein phosphatase [Acidimicrobiia bacterium]
MEEGTARSRVSGSGQLAVRAPAIEEQRQTDAGLHQSGSWAEPLQQLALALVRSVSLDDVAAAIVAYGTVAAGARWSHVLLVDGHGAPGVSLLAGPGVPSCRLDTPDPRSPAPWNDALREARQLTFPSTDALLDAYPDLKPLLALESRGPVITTPLVAVDDRCGAMTFGFDRPPVGGADAAGNAPLETIAELSGRAAVRAAVYAGEHQSAELLQRAYLPTRLSPLGDVSFASRYLPAGEPVGVGGDWYDLLPLPDGRIGVVMGDVAGHGLQAADVMASLRGALRAF